MIASAQVAYWDRVAGKKTFAHPLDVRLLARLAGAGARVLDCGCGYGRLGPILTGAGLAVVGIDPALGMARRARRAETAIVAEGARLPLPDDSFDAALLFTVLTSVPESAHQRAIVAELTRVLRPGGILYASDLLLQDDARNRRRYDGRAGASDSERGAYGTFRLEGAVFRHHDRAWLETLFSDFNPVAVREIDATTMNGNPARGLQWIGRLRRARDGEPA